MIVHQRQVIDHIVLAVLSLNQECFLSMNDKQVACCHDWIYDNYLDHLDAFDRDHHGFVCSLFLFEYELQQYNAFV